MKLLILISLIACGYAAKLDRTYLPPASASSAGGSPGSLLAPGSGSFGQAPLDTSSAFGRRPASQSEIGPPSFGSELTTSGSDQPSQNGFQSGGLTTSDFGQTSGSPGYGQPLESEGYGSGSYNQPSDNVAEFGPSAGPGFDSFGAGQSNFPGSFQAANNQGSSLGQEEGSNNIQAYNQPQGFQAAAEEGAQILKYDSQNDGETYSYSFETSNGIRAEESGVATNGVRAKGGFGYTGEDGQDYSITYTADENGYQPHGEHIPTPFPIPEEILKSIEKNAQAAAAGTQEGAYRPEEYENEDSTDKYSNVESSYNGPAQGPSQLYGAPQYDSGSNQETQGYTYENQRNQEFEQNQNQGFGQGQSVSVIENQKQSQFASSGPLQDFSATSSRGPQAQSSFGQVSGANQGYGQTSFGKNVASNQDQSLNEGTDQSSSRQGDANKVQGYGGQISQGHSSFEQGDSNQGQNFIGEKGADQSGYEYSRPQGPGQFGSTSSDQSVPQSPLTSFSRPGTGSIEGSFTPTIHGPKNTYLTPSQLGQDSKYQPAQSTIGSGPSGSSSIGQAPTGPQNGAFGSTAQGPKNTYLTPTQPGQDSKYQPAQSTFGSGPSGSSSIGQAPTGPQNGAFGSIAQSPKNTYLTPTQPGKDSKYQPAQSTFGSGPSGSSSIGQVPTGPQNGAFGPTAEGPKNTYITPNQPGLASEYQPGQSTYGSGPSSSSFIGQAPAGPQNQYIPPSGQPDSGFNQGSPTFGGPRQPPSFSPEEGYKY